MLAALGWDLHLYIYTRREEDLASPADRVGVAWGERACAAHERCVK